MWVHNCDGKSLSEFLWANLPHLRIKVVPRVGCSGKKRLDLKPVAERIGVTRKPIQDYMRYSEMPYRYIKRLRDMALEHSNVSVAPIEKWLEFVSDAD